VVEQQTAMSLQDYLDQLLAILTEREQQLDEMGARVDEQSATEAQLKAKLADMENELARIQAERYVNHVGGLLDSCRCFGCLTVLTEMRQRAPA
jgi:peptidoglycan hydrolase CwlO-like protein